MASDASAVLRSVLILISMFAALHQVRQAIEKVLTSLRSCEYFRTIFNWQTTSSSILFSLRQSLAGKVLLF